ncbi:hypothetical protein QYO98_12400 [Pseudomonas aeruginosa]|nr:hypothetical protein [Pseudomonas aeruginosa]
MRLIQLKLRFHEMVYPTTQGDVGVAKQICVEGVHHTCDLETLALKLLIRRDGVAAVGLSQSLAVFSRRGSAVPATLVG